jgi:AcrR family transcriptional regulator
MSITYDQTGRVDQKRRTRQALIESVRTLVADGLTPTVEEAAAAASISRTTAYRYFPSQRALLVAAFPEIEATSLLPSNASGDLSERFNTVVDAITTIVVETEPQQRTMLRLSLEADAEERSALVLRQGRAIRWIEDALSPLHGQVPADELRRLVLAVRATIGIESYVWLRDVAGLSPDEAVATMHWSASALLQKTMADTAQPTRRRAKP